MRNFNLLLLLTFLMLMIPLCYLAAAEDDTDIDGYTLPAVATSLSQLTVQDDHYFLSNELFTGVAYDRYASGQLKKVIYLQKGLRNGPTFAWYPKGQKMMAADYRDGKLNGSFMGWYEYGATMYNLVYRNGRLSADQAFLDNDDRQEEAQDDSQQEGDATQKEGD